MAPDSGGFQKASHFLIVWLPGFEFFDQFFYAQDVHRPFQVVNRHDQGHLPIHFLQPFEVGVVVAPFAFIQIQVVIQDSHLYLLPCSLFGAGAGFLLVYEPIRLLVYGFKNKPFQPIVSNFFWIFLERIGKEFFHSLPLATIILELIK